MVKSVKMILAEYNNEMKPFLINDEAIEIGDTVCELLVTDKWLPMTIHTINDIDVTNQKKIIATPDQLGYIVYNEWVTNEFGIKSFDNTIREIDSNDIDTIINDENVIDNKSHNGATYGGFNINVAPYLILYQRADTIKP